MGSILGLSKALGLDKKFTYNPLGFTEMMFLDPSGFDQQHYVFSYVRREFLGSVRTWVFDVHPKVSGQGRFYGRIWIEDEGGNIVRFNGTFTPPTNEDSSKYLLPLRQLAHERAAGGVASGGNLRGGVAARPRARRM